MAASIAGALAASSDKGALRYRSMDVLLSMAGLSILVEVSILGAFDNRLRNGLSVKPKLCFCEVESAKQLA
jgi:hypothetical protein